MRAIIFGLAVLVSSLAHAAVTEISGRLEQGGIAIGHVAVGTRVVFNNRPIAVTDDGKFVLGFDRDAPASARLVITQADGKVETRMLDIKPRQWQIENVKGLPQKLVTPDPATEAQIAENNKLMVAAREHTVAVPFF